MMELLYVYPVIQVVRSVISHLIQVCFIIFGHSVVCFILRIKLNLSNLTYFIQWRINQIKQDDEIVMQLINIAQCAQQDRIKLFLINLIVFEKQVMVIMAFLAFAFVIIFIYQKKLQNVITHVNIVMDPQQLIAHPVHPCLIVIQLLIISVFATKLTLILESAILYVHTFVTIHAPIVMCLERINAQIVQLQDNQIEVELHLNAYAKILILVMSPNQIAWNAISPAQAFMIIQLFYFLLLQINFFIQQLSNRNQQNSFDCNCLACNLAYRQLIQFKCICPYGYYDVGSLQCSPCYYTCMTCFGPEEDNCITCAVSTAKNIFDFEQYSRTNREFKANKCLCLDISEFNDAHQLHIDFKVLHNTYLEILVGDPICYKCSYRYANCIGTLDNCTSCPIFSYRDLGTNNACSYPAKSNDQPGNPICIICHQTCLTCNGAQSVNCTSCNVQIMRQLDPSGFCLCLNKYYNVGQPECLACSAYCLECETSADNCISCKPDRFLQGNICICKTMLNGAAISSYQVQSKIECQNCHNSCLT